MNEALATWVPPQVLVGVLLVMIAAFWRSLSIRLDKIETALSGLHRFATIEQLGNLGNRHDERIADVRERLRVLESVVEARSETIDEIRKSVHEIRSSLAAMAIKLELLKMADA